MLFEPLEPRRFFAGVTLVTHGFNSNASDWVTAMGNAVAQQSGNLADQPRYLLTVTDDHHGGPFKLTSQRLGPDPAHWGSGEIIVLLDWSDVAGSLPFGGNHRSTADVGAFVANTLLSSGWNADITRPLAELPIHMIGHSRGGSLISEIAKGLAQHGAWVDELSYLDPHPVNGGSSNFNLNFGDPAMAVYDNVQFADDYYHLDPGNAFDFSGVSVNGADDVQLSEPVLSNGGYSTDHSDVHLWYHGTIGPPFSDSDGGATIGSGWYNGTMGPRDQIGWDYSRIARGTRPAAGLKSSGAHRDAVALTVAGANVWDDVAIGNLVDDFTLSQGTPVGVNVNFEDRSVGGTRDATITVGLDRDDNPYDGVFGSGVQFSTASLGSDSFTANLPTADVAGAFHVYAKISNGVNTRYYYAPGRAVITVPGFEQTWIGAARGDWSIASNWSGGAVPGAADHVAIYDSDVTLGVSTKIAGLRVAGASGGTLDLGSHSFVIDYPNVSPLGTWTGNAYDGVSGMIASGRLRSSAATTSLYGLGTAEASQVLGLSGTQVASWRGQSVDASCVLVSFTYRGDANVDGKIDVSDYGRIDFNAPLATSGWFNGDFNFDGKIDISDYGIIDFNIGIQGPPL